MPSKLYRASIKQLIKAGYRVHQDDYGHWWTLPSLACGTYQPTEQAAWIEARNDYLIQPVTNQ